jgi:V/A-type H+-transporting ATPase subunit E
MSHSSKQNLHADASVGVEALIQKLKQEGVDAGQTQAKAVVEEAEQRAQWIVDQAKEEADRLLTQAKEEARRLEDQSKVALSQAVRDMNLSVQRELTLTFEALVHQKIQNTLDDEALLASLVEQVVLRTVGVQPKTPVEVILPERAIDLETLKADPEEHQNRPLSQLVKRWSESMMAEGLSVKVTPTSGFKVITKEHGVELDLTCEQIEALLLEHLRPRFRALLEGVIR